jgi:hypothetical protein
MMRISNKSGNNTEVITLDAGLYTRTLNGVQQEQRALTPTEQAALTAYETEQTASNNKSAIETNLTQDMAAMQAIVDTANSSIVVTTLPQAQQAARDALQRDKNIAAMLKRLGRTALKDYTGTT